MPACSLIWIWLIDGKMYSTGSSIVMMLRSGLLISPSDRVQRGGLAAAGRAGADHHAVRGVQQLSSIARRHVVGHAELRELEQRAALVQQPEHDLLAADDRRRRDANVDGAAFDVAC